LFVQHGRVAARSRRHIVIGVCFVHRAHLKKGPARYWTDGPQLVQALIQSGGEMPGKRIL
jgi:hypothetical protein